jgi:hypothetical protein
LILDIESKLNLKEPTNRKESELGIIYFIAFGELTLNKTISINIILTSKVFSYLLILKDITKPTLIIDPFIYILNISNSRYTSDMFLGIIIDIKTSRKSTTSYN